MQKDTVYYYKACYIKTGEEVLSKRMATLETIKRMGPPRCEPLMDTVKEVDESEIDENGYYKEIKSL